MEIIDYLRGLGKFLLVLILVPVLAGIGAAAYALSSPVTYSATATVATNTFVGGAETPYNGTQGTNQFVAAFSAAANGPQVINAVAEETQVPQPLIRDNLVVDQRGASSDMSLTFTSTEKNRVEPVLRDVVEETLSAMFAPRARLAEQQRESAREAVREASAAVEAFGVEAGVADPEEAYRSKLSQVSSLEEQQANLRATGDSVAAAVLDEPLKEARDELDELGPLLRGYRDLLAAQSAAVQDLASAQAEARHAAGLVRASTSSDVTFIGGTSKDDRTAGMWALVLPAVAAGIFLAVVLAAALELLRKRRTEVSSERGSSRMETTA